MPLPRDSASDGSPCRDRQTLSATTVVETGGVVVPWLLWCAVNPLGPWHVLWWSVKICGKPAGCVVDGALCGGVLGFVVSRQAVWSMTHFVLAC